MATQDNSGGHYQFAISLSVLNHLGRNLYRNFVTVLGEAISNAWDADANNVWIDIDWENSRFYISDDGEGMDAESFQNKFLKIGYSKRKEKGPSSEKGRPFIGAKGIGKLALLSCARRISVFTKTAGQDYTGGVIDNNGLDAAIQNDLIPDEYPLEDLDFNLIEGLFNSHEQGTIIVFEGADEVLRHSEEYIRKILALSFRFSLIDKDFTIYVNDVKIGLDDLAGLRDSTQILWSINEFSDGYTESLANLEANLQNLKSELPIKGFVASVKLPRNLKIHGMNDRASFDLFVNGRLRDKNLLRHVPTQRIVESYIYGQIHFDSLDRDQTDPFTSSREGIVEDDPEFKKLLHYLERVLLPKIIDDWDKIRLEIGSDGDEENTRRKSKKSRRAASFVAAAEEEFVPNDDGSADGRDKVEGWLDDLRPDAEFNISAYMDCFLSENLVRRYIKEEGVELIGDAPQNVDKYKKQEETGKGKANISFAIRADDDDLGYLDMNDLAHCAEGSKTTDGKPSLWADAVQYGPARNAVGHTGLLTDDAKHHLNGIFRNIKGRIKGMLAKKG